MYEEMSLLEFQQAFGSEEACLKYLFEKRCHDDRGARRCGRKNFNAPTAGRASTTF